MYDIAILSQNVVRSRLPSYIIWSKYISIDQNENYIAIFGESIDLSLKPG